MPHLPHDGGLPLKHVAGGIFGTVFKRIGKCGGDEGAVGAAELLGRAAEMLLCYGFGPVDAVSHLDGVKVDFHDALLAPAQFDQDSEVGLESFADP